MEMNTPFVHFLETHNDLYLFDVNTNMISKVNERIYKYFSGQGKKEDLEDEDISIVDNMKNMGMLGSNPIERIEHPMSNLIEDILENSLSRLTLQVTQNCNFRCEYCVYSGSYHNRVHNNKRMDWDTAKAALDFLEQHSRNSSEINVSFYGGEPLLEMDLIKRCVDYCHEKFKRKKVTFNLTTNASLLTDDVIKYFEKENFLVMISLDGPQEVHDKNRTFADGKRGTYEVVIERIERIREIAPDFLANVTLNAVLDDENNFSLINQYFAQEPAIKDIFVSTNYVNDTNRIEKIEQSNQENYIEICNEKFIALMYLMKRVSRDKVSKMVVRDAADIQETIGKRKVSKQVTPNITHPGGPCLPGAQRPFVNAYGKLFPCERVNETCNEMCIGNIYDGFNMEAVKRLLNVGQITEENCKKCWAINFCTQCGVTADNGNKMTPEVRLEKCGAVRNHVDNLLKDYIVLKECGCDFTQKL